MIKTRATLLLLSALVLVVIGGLPAAALAPVAIGNLNSHSPTGPPTMPWMGDMPGMDHGDGTTGTSASDRPLKPVLGVFGVGTSAVLLGAVFLRRKDRALSRTREANIAARGTRR